MTTPIRHHASPLPMPFSKAVSAGGFVFLSGVLPMDEQARLVGDDVATQARVVIERIGATLRELGAGLDRVVRVQVFLADWADFAAFNGEYRRHFGPDFPARTTVVASLWGGAKVEIEAQAWVG